MRGFSEAHDSALERIARAHQAKGGTALPTKAALFAAWSKIFPEETKSDVSVYVKFKKVYSAVDEEAAAVGLHKLIMKDVSRRTGASRNDSAMLITPINAPWPFAQ